MKILENKLTINFISIIWGLGLSCLFYKICNERDCLIFKAPNIHFIKNNIWKYNNKKLLASQTQKLTVKLSFDSETPSRKKIV